jgi:hypothetical protein
LEIDNINRKSIKADTISMLPISTKKLASLFQNTLKEGCVWARTAATKAMMAPTAARMLKTESEASVRHKTDNVLTIVVWRIPRLLNFDLVAKTYPTPTITTKLGRYIAKKKDGASNSLMFKKIKKKRGLNIAYAPSIIPTRVPISRK